MSEVATREMRLPPLVLTPADAAELLDRVGEGAEVVLLGRPDRGDDAPAADPRTELNRPWLRGIEISHPRLEVVLDVSDAWIAWEVDFDPGLEIARWLRSRRRGRLWPLTHGDSALLVGAALPLAAGLAAGAHATSAAAVGAGAWFFHAWWAARNSSRRWCEFRRP